MKRSRRKQIKPVGARRERLMEWHAWCSGAVRARCYGTLDASFQFNRCEAGCGEPWIDWAHLFGRGNIIAEPWCSLPALTAGLCRRCHDAIDQDRDPELRDRLRRRALVRLARAFPELARIVQRGLVAPPGECDPVDVARTCERWLRANLTKADLPACAPEWLP